MKAFWPRGGSVHDPGEQKKSAKVHVRPESSVNVHKTKEGGGEVGDDGGKEAESNISVS